jgi:hypothetical protein
MDAATGRAGLPPFGFTVCVFPKGRCNCGKQPLCQSPRRARLCNATIADDASYETSGLKDEKKREKRALPKWINTYTKMDQGP